MRLKRHQIWAFTGGPGTNLLWIPKVNWNKGSRYGVIGYLICRVQFSLFWQKHIDYLPITGTQL